MIENWWKILRNEEMRRYEVADTVEKMREARIR